MRAQLKAWRPSQMFFSWKLKCLFSESPQFWLVRHKFDSIWLWGPCQNDFSSELLDFCVSLCIEGRVIGNYANKNLSKLPLKLNWQIILCVSQMWGFFSWKSHSGITFATARWIAFCRDTCSLIPSSDFSSWRVIISTSLDLVSSSCNFRISGLAHLNITVVCVNIGMIVTLTKSCTRLSVSFFITLYTLNVTHCAVCNRMNTFLMEACLLIL